MAYNPFKIHYIWLYKKKTIKIEKWNVTFYETYYEATALNRKCDKFEKKLVNSMTNLSKKSLLIDFNRL